MTPIISSSSLAQIADVSVAVVKGCKCLAVCPQGWQGWPVQIRDDQFTTLGKISDDVEDLSIDEYHPCGTSFWSSAAPIALKFYPCNLCNILQCVTCGRAYLYYIEAGAYHAEKRIRFLDPNFIVYS